MPPQSIQAIKIIATPSGQKAELQQVPLPTLKNDYVLCKVLCVALNPTDWKHIDGDGGRPGSTVGSDFCGIICATGANVPPIWQEGDRIAAFVHGGNESDPEQGCFGEYCLAKAELGVKVPDGMSDEEAATLGVGVITCGQALYLSLGLPLPDVKEKYGGYLLVYGGSTATGMLAIQYATLSGCKVLTTASERNWPHLKSLGAEATFDYKDPLCATKIRDYTNNRLTLAFDCVSEGSSATICEEAISSNNDEAQRIITYLLKSQNHARKDITKKHTSGYHVFSEAFDKLGEHVPVKQEDFEHTKMFWRLTQRLLEEGLLRAPPIEIGKGGLGGVFEGLQRMREGGVSGVKLVYRIGER